MRKVEVMNTLMFIMSRLSKDEKEHLFDRHDDIRDITDPSLISNCSVAELEGAIITVISECSWKNGHATDLSGQILYSGSVSAMVSGKESGNGTMISGSTGIESNPDNYY